MQIRNQLFIDGAYGDAADGRTFEVLNPATGQVITRVQQGSAADLRRAITVARKAFDATWGSLNPAQRGALLHKVGDAIARHAEFLAQVETDDVGKPIFESRNIDVASAAATFHYFADACVEVLGTLQPSPYNEVFDYTIREPVGVVGAIIPWNFPFLIAARKIASALAAGNTIVIKPATWAPLSTLLFGELAAEAGLPAGVLNVVPAGGADTGKAFTESLEIDEVSFTGSTEVGTLLGSACAPRLKGCTLELGGKSPGVVLPDCDIDETVAGTLFGVFLNQGECCCGLTRLIVHADVYEAFVQRFVAGAQAIPVGLPRDEATRMGPLVHRHHLASVMDYVAAGQREGATLLCGGHALHKGPLAAGCFMAPTVFADVTPAMRIWKEEIFGPVVTLTKAASTEEMVTLANATTYGLAASVWTRDLKTAHTLARRIRAGTVWFNLHNFVFPSAPYTGYKCSGVGSELGKEGVIALTRPKNVMVSLFPGGFKWY